MSRVSVERATGSTNAVNSTNIGVSAYMMKHVKPPYIIQTVKGHTGVRPPGGEVVAQLQLGSLQVLALQELVVGDRTR